MTRDDDFLLLRLAEVAREVVLHLIYRDLLHLTPLPFLAQIRGRNTYFTALPLGANRLLLHRVGLTKDLKAAPDYDGGNRGANDQVRKAATQDNDKRAGENDS